MISANERARHLGDNTLQWAEYKDDNALSVKSLQNLNPRMWITKYWQCKFLLRACVVLLVKSHKRDLRDGTVHSPTSLTFFDFWRWNKIYACSAIMIAPGLPYGANKYAIGIYPTLRLGQPTLPEKTKCSSHSEISHITGYGTSDSYPRVRVSSRMYFHLYVFNSILKDSVLLKSIWVWQRAF